MKELSMGVVDLFVVSLPFYGSFHMHNSLELGVFSGLIAPTYLVRVLCTIAQWFEVCLCVVLCCRFEPLPAELPW